MPYDAASSHKYRYLEKAVTLATLVKELVAVNSYVCRNASIPGESAHLTDMDVP